MKQEYTTPEVLIEKIELQQMIALSATTDVADPEAEVLGREENGFDENGGRRKDVWDDEEEDDAEF